MGYRESQTPYKLSHDGSYCLSHSVKVFGFRLRSVCQCDFGSAVHWYVFLLDKNWFRYRNNRTMQATALKLGEGGGGCGGACFSFVLYIVGLRLLRAETKCKVFASGRKSSSTKYIRWRLSRSAWTFQADHTKPSIGTVGGEGVGTGLGLGLGPPRTVQFASTTRQDSPPPVRNEEGHFHLTFFCPAMPPKDRHWEGGCVRQQWPDLLVGWLSRHSDVHAAIGVAFWRYNSSLWGL